MYWNNTNCEISVSRLKKDIIKLFSLLISLFSMSKNKSRVKEMKNSEKGV